jgi:hypothetical protein
MSGTSRKARPYAEHGPAKRQYPDRIRDAWRPDQLAALTGPDCTRYKNRRPGAKMRPETFHEFNPALARGDICIAVPSDNRRVPGSEVVRDLAGRRPFDPGVDSPVGEGSFARVNHGAATVEASRGVAPAGQGDQLAASASGSHDHAASRGKETVDGNFFPELQAGIKPGCPRVFLSLAVTPL